MNGIRTADYLRMVADKIAEAEDRKDVAECIRLGKVTLQAMGEYVFKCETYQAVQPKDQTQI